jgi:hypothetical protein
MIGTNDNSLNELAATLAQLLQREEEGLRHGIEVMRELNDALRKGDLKMLDDARKRQMQHVRNMEPLNDARESLRRQVACLLSVRTDEVTLSNTAAVLPSPYREQILASRDQLQTLALEAREWQQRNGSMIVFSKNYFQKLFGDVLEPAGARYDGAGRKLDSHAGSMLKLES